MDQLPILDESGKAIPHTIDARVWAKEFMRTVAANPEIATDEETMLGWFANAIMAGFDESARRSALLRPKVAVVIEFLETPGHIPFPLTGRSGTIWEFCNHDPVRGFVGTRLSLEKFREIKEDLFSVSNRRFYYPIPDFELVYEEAPAEPSSLGEGIQSIGQSSPGSLTITEGSAPAISAEPAAEEEPKAQMDTLPVVAAAPTPEEEPIANKPPVEAVPDEKPPVTPETPVADTIEETAENTTAPIETTDAPIEEAAPTESTAEPEDPFAPTDSEPVEEPIAETIADAAPSTPAVEEEAIDPADIEPRAPRAPRRNRRA